MHKRHVALSLTLTLAIVTQMSLAQTASSPSTGASTASASAQGSVPDGPGKDRANKIIERFKKADSNHDGKLTRAEAEGKMPMVFRHFDKIDVNKKGYVTLEDIADFVDKSAGRKGK